MVDSVEKLRDFFWYAGHKGGITCTINVPTRIRKEFLLEDARSLVTVKCGRVESVVWKNLGGGVWQASVIVGGV